MPFQLRGVSDNEIGFVFPIIPDRQLWVGRAKTADIWLDNHWVSRRHCMFRQTGDDLFIKDDGSRNGSYVNGARLAVDELQLHHGDVVKICDVKLLVEELITFELDTPFYVVAFTG